MPNIVNVAADAEPTTEPTVEELTARAETAREALDQLVAERRDKRATLSRQEWAEYNDDTAETQRQAAAALEGAQRALARRLGREARRVTVGHTSEKGKS